MKTFSTQPEQETSRPIVCDVCGSGRTRPHWDCGTFRFVRCTDCGVLYQNPQPVEENILDRYGQQYFEYERKNEDSFYRLMELGLKDIGFAKWPQEELGERRFLDIGCATGRLIWELGKKGWLVKGVEVCQASAKFAKEDRGLDVYCGTIQSAPYKEASFDVIHFSHVIEHINQPRDFLAKIVSLLAPGGSLLITTPNTAGLQAHLFGPAWRSAIADHLYLFNRRNLGQLLRGLGLEVRAFRTWGGLAAGSGHPRWKKILDPLSKKWGFGDVMMLRAVKEAK